MASSVDLLPLIHRCYTAPAAETFLQMNAAVRPAVVEVVAQELDHSVRSQILKKNYFGCSPIKRFGRIGNGPGCVLCVDLDCRIIVGLNTPPP